jgi:glycosyltransferase involved in cell wall biosynthesis
MDKKACFITNEIKQNSHIFFFKEKINSSHTVFVMNQKINQNINLFLRIFLEFIIFFKILILCIFKIKKVNLLVIQISPLYNFILYFFLHMLNFSEKNICYIGDYWPFAFKKFIKPKLIYVLFEKIAKKIYLKFDHFIVMNNFTQNHLRKVISHTGVILKIFPGIYKKSIIKKKKYKDKFYFLYFGNIGFFQPLEFIIDAFLDLNKKYKDIYFDIIGQGINRGQLIKKYKMLLTKNISFIKYKSPDEIYKNNFYNVHIVSVKGGIQGNIPSKVSFGMSAQIPNLIFADGECERQFKNMSLFGRPESYKDAYRLMELAIVKNKLLKKNLINSNKFYFNNFSQGKIKNNINNFISQII